MSLNIKNERVHQLVREAAQRTGLSQTSVIEEALKSYLRDLDEEQSSARRRVDEILAVFDARVSDQDRAETRKLMDDLYDDETGLPR